MIVSASRRTDLPGYYMPWLIERLRAGSCEVVNPRNARQRRTIDLSPDAVDAVVFWTRHPSRLARELPRIEQLGHARSVALVTVTALDRRLEPHVPREDRAVSGLRRLSAHYGDPRRVVWRYDPIVLGPGNAAGDHLQRFGRLAAALEGATTRVVVSLLDIYARARRRLARASYVVEQVGGPGASPGLRSPRSSPRNREPDPRDRTIPAQQLLGELSRIACRHGMSLQLCAEEERFGPRAPAGACIDGEWLASLFPERSFPHAKDPGQRPLCRCVRSVDIGAVDTCLAGCLYCYATSSTGAALRRHAAHDPSGPALIPPAT